MKGEAVFAEQDTTKEAIRADAHAVAWKRKLLSKLTPDIEHVPRELYQAIWFFISHSGTIKWRLASTQYFRSRISRGGLEIMIDYEVTIEAGKLAFIDQLQSTILTQTILIQQSHIRSQ